MLQQLWHMLISGLHDTVNLVQQLAFWAADADELPGPEACAVWPSAGILRSSCVCVYQCMKLTAGMLVVP